MKTIPALLLLCWTVLQINAAEPGGVEWMTDLPKAQAKAKAENKLVLVEFTGSDWCPPCMMLKRQVFSAPEFKEYARKNLILVELDFPRKKELPEDQKQANEALARKYKIEGFPTVIVFDKDGKQLSRDVGYHKESAKEYVAKLEKLQKR